MPAELILVTILRALVEVAGFALLGQGVLALFAGRRRQENFVYRLLKTITDPLVRAVRWVTPRFIRDDHVPLVAFFILFWLWIGLAILKRSICTGYALAC